MTPGGGVNQYKVRNTQESDQHPAMPSLHPALPGSVPSPDRNFLSCEVPVQSYLFRTTSPRRQKYYGFFFIHASSPTFHHIYFPYAVLRIFAGICRIIVRRLFSFAVVRQIAYFISRFFIMIIPIQVNSTPCITKIAATTENHSATVITCTLWNIATGQYIEIT